MTFGLATFGSRAGDVALRTLPVCARDSFGFAPGGFYLRLKNGVGQDDAGEEMKFFETSRLHSDSGLYRLNAGAALCSATIFFALSASAFACGSNSRPLTTSGSDSARTFMPSSCPKASVKISDLMF